MLDGLAAVFGSKLSGRLRIQHMRSSSKKLGAQGPLPRITHLLLEAPANPLERRIRSYGRNLLFPIECLPATISELGNHADQLRSGRCLPLGSHDFLRAALSIAGARPIVWNRHPAELFAYMRQRPREMRLESVLRSKKKLFVKSLKEQFPPFILDPHGDGWRAHTRAYELLRTLSPRERVQVADPLKIESEWRFYVHRNDLLDGCMRGQRGGATATACG